MKYSIKETPFSKEIISENFNMIFDKNTGLTLTCGKTQEEDPDMCPYGPVIADIEISSVCGQGCRFCYKSNTTSGKNMSFDTFKKIFHKLPRTLTQIAFGIGDINSCPDIKRIFEYCRNNDYQSIVPNVTINGSHMTNEWYDFISSVCGAVAVSYYDDNKCFSAVKEFTDRGMNQVNIHAMVSEETFDRCFNLIDKVNEDMRLEKLNAVVFLMLKQKGRGESLNILSDKKYGALVDKAFKSKIGFGFDSCGSGRLLNYGVNDVTKQLIEPCESGLFSMYINTDGIFYPCSFTENCFDWDSGIDVLSCDDFLKDVWYNKKLIKWRKELLDNKRNCPKYKI